MAKILEDIRVLDLTDHVFGPYCTMILAAHGADVVKVEPPWGNSYRIVESAIVGGASPGWHAVNLGKRGMAVDLKQPQGLEIVRRLVPKSDVVIQNFLPGVMERLGLGYEELRALNPKVIYAALSGFGQTGPNRDRASFAGIAQSVSGWSRQAGRSIDPEGPPRGMGGPIGDLLPAVYTAVSVIAAIRHRDLTGLGQMIDSSQAEAMVAVNSAVASYSMTVNLPAAAKSNSLAMNLGGYFRVRDGWINAAGQRAKSVDNLKQALGLDELTNADIERYVSGMTRTEAVDRLGELGWAVGPVYEAKDIVEDPHFKARGTLTEVTHPKAGRAIYPDYPIKHTVAAPGLDAPAPLLGQHNREILTGLLGYTDAEVDAFEKSGVIVTEKAGADAQLDDRHPRRAWKP